MSAANGNLTRPARPGRGLSARILLLAIFFILIGEILIFIPSIARFRFVFLEERIAASHIAVIPSTQMPQFNPDEATAEKLLAHAGVTAITLRDPEARVMLGGEAYVAYVYDLRDANPLSLIVDAFEALSYGGKRTIRVIDQSPMDPGTLIEVLIDEAELWREMRDYAIRILTLTAFLSGIVGLLIFLSLRWLIVAPLRDLTDHIAVFHNQPENNLLDMPYHGRSDEIGVVQAALRDMQASVRQSLQQKTRLAGLGEAVSKISHDLRNILSSAVLISDRLESSADPEVQRSAPRLVDSLNRAIRLSTITLNYARSGLPALRRQRFDLAEVLRDCAQSVQHGREDLRFEFNLASGLRVDGDPDQLARAFSNLFNNAAEAMQNGGVITTTAKKEQLGQLRNRVVITIKDQGPGIPEQVQPQLFEPFMTSAKTDGSGLGLAITKEIVHAHGGSIRLLSSSVAGSVFRLELAAV